jgi:hypothetical protein
MLEFESNNRMHVAPADKLSSQLSSAFWLKLALVDSVYSSIGGLLE